MRRVSPAWWGGKDTPDKGNVNEHTGSTLWNPRPGGMEWSRGKVLTPMHSLSALGGFVGRGRWGGSEAQPY